MKANTIQYKNPPSYSIHLHPLSSSSSIIYPSSSSFLFFDCLRLASRYETHLSSDISISISNPLRPSQMDPPRQTNSGPGSPEGNHQDQPAARYVHKTSKLSYILSHFLYILYPLFKCLLSSISFQRATWTQRVCVSYGSRLRDIGMALSHLAPDTGCLARHPLPSPSSHMNIPFSTLFRNPSTPCLGSILALEIIPWRSKDHLLTFRA